MKPAVHHSDHRFFLCGDNSTLSGFSISNETCSTLNGKTVLNYLSVANYRQWIEEVFKSDSADRESFTIYVVNVVTYTKPNLNTARTVCVGTAITSNHLLTTATCVYVEPETNTGVGVQAYFENKGWNTGEHSTQV